MVFIIFSRSGDRYTETRPIYLPLRRALPIRPWHRFPGYYRDMCIVAGERFRSLQNHVNQELSPDRIRPAGSRGGNLR